MAAGVISASVYAGEMTCGAGGVVINSTNRTDAPLVCEGARDAVVFLASQGFELPARIEIDVVPQLPDDVSASAAGFYRETDRRVLILSYPAFKEHRNWFGIPIDRSLYRSLVSHEVAHAVAAHNFQVPDPPIQAKEYVAYVTMLSTMAPEQRDRVLRAFPGQGFEGEWQMNTLVYLVDPMWFGVRAYRHFLGQASGRDYLHEILTGNVLLE